MRENNHIHPLPPESFVRAKHDHGCRQTEVVPFPGLIPKSAELQNRSQTSTEKYTAHDPFPPAAAGSAILRPQRRRAAGKGFAPLCLRADLPGQLLLPHRHRAWLGPRARCLPKRNVSPCRPATVQTPLVGVSWQARFASARVSGTEGWQATLRPGLVPCMQGACSSRGGESAIVPLLRRKAARYALAEVLLPC